MIAINYLQGRFWIDLISAIPFELVLTLFIDPTKNKFVADMKILTMLKIIRVLRLERIINYMNTTDENKLSMRLFKMCFFLILYLHIGACIWYYFARMDDTWIPFQYEAFANGNNITGGFYE